MCLLYVCFFLPDPTMLYNEHRSFKQYDAQRQLRNRMQVHEAKLGIQEGDTSAADFDSNVIAFGTILSSADIVLEPHNTMDVSESAAQPSLSRAA